MIREKEAQHPNFPIHLINVMCYIPNIHDIWHMINELILREISLIMDQSGWVPANQLVVLINRILGNWVWNIVQHHSLSSSMIIISGICIHFMYNILYIYTIFKIAMRKTTILIIKNQSHCLPTQGNTST